MRELPEPVGVGHRVVGSERGGALWSWLKDAGGNPLNLLLGGIVSFPLIVGFSVAAAVNAGDRRLEELGWVCSLDGRARAGLDWRR